MQANPLLLNSNLIVTITCDNTKCDVQFLHEKKYYLLVRKSIQNYINHLTIGILMSKMDIEMIFNGLKFL
jgi:hypothetical protein